MRRRLVVLIAAVLPLAVSLPARAQFDDEEETKPAKPAPKKAADPEPPKPEEKKPEPKKEDPPPEEKRAPEATPKRSEAPPPAENEATTSSDEQPAGRQELPDSSNLPKTQAPRELTPSDIEGAQVKQKEPPLRSLSVGLGGILSFFGGIYPAIPLKGTSDHGFYAHGLGGLFEVNYDFPAMDLDWRVYGQGAYPAGLVTVGGTAGIKKLLGPWENPIVIARGGAGAEIFMGAGKPETLLLVPTLVATGESGIEYMVNEKTGLGAFLELGFRYSPPLGIGFSIGAAVRGSFGL